MMFRGMETPSEALNGERVTTMAKASRAKWLEAQSTREGDEIVCSTDESRSCLGGSDVTNRSEHTRAHEKATFLGTVNRQFDDSFGRSDGKIGDTLRIRLPSQYTRTTGTRVMDVQDSVQQRTTLTAATQDHVDMRFNSRELALDLENFSKLHLDPAMAVLISGIESDVLQGVTKLVYNVAGTAGTAISSLTVPTAARAKLNQYLAPKDQNRAIQMDSVTIGSIVTGTASYFNPSRDISEQFREGRVARTAMADYYENERVWTMTNGSDVACGLDNYVVPEGGTSCTVSSWATPTVGMVFTFASSYAVHPETKAQYSHLQQFVVLDGSTATTVLFSPAIYSSGPRQNVNVMPNTSSTLTFIGAASTSYVQSVMYHKDAFAFVTAELPLMGGAEKCVRQTYDGISLRVWQDPDIRNDELLTRIDILYGYQAIRPQWACRMIGAAN